jgi:hypothetical protein
LNKGIREVERLIYRVEDEKKKSEALLKKEIAKGDKADKFRK